MTRTRPGSQGSRWAVLAATLFGVGRAPIAPGTAGSLAALPLVMLAGSALPAWGFAVLAALLIGLAVLVSDAASRALGDPDPKSVVLDEVAGQFVTFVAWPLDAWTLAGGFVLFRVADVLKPPPARQAERLPGGIGIVADDVVAGLYANLALRVLALVWSGWIG